MSEEFKRRLQAYTEGKLQGSDKEQMELELAKLEIYQAYLEEQLEMPQQTEAADGDSPREAPAWADTASHAGPSAWPPHKEASLLRRGKWKARLHTALTAIGIVIGATLLSAILTSLYYGTGGRAGAYQDAVASAIAVTRPNLAVSGSSSSGAFFTMDYRGQLTKTIGASQTTVGDMQLKFLLGYPSLEQTTWRGDTNSANGAYVFQLPGSSQPIDSSQAWNTLDKLPEGTVAEAFISLDRLVSTDELLQRFKGKNLQPLWLAAYTGEQASGNDLGVVVHPTGFPAMPLWHRDDMKVVSHAEEKRGWLGTVVTESSSSPAVQAYGGGAVRDRNFLDTLHVLQAYPSVAKRLAPWLALDASVSYLEANGVQLYGVVVTGPAKELLKLKAEPWVASLSVGDVRLWNWYDLHS